METVKNTILSILVGLLPVTLLVLLVAKCTPEPVAAKVVKVSLPDLTCMAHAVYHEARGEPFEGQLAVAYVVKNRAEADSHPDSFCDVVYQPNQFTDIRGTIPKLDSKEWTVAMRVSLIAISNKQPDPTRGARFFYAPKAVSKPKWAMKGVELASIGGHKFYDLQEP